MPRGDGNAASRRHDHLRLGRHGEDLVARWYVSRGAQVLARNWRCKQGEIDLVLLEGREVVFCEVKTRSSGRYGSPFEAVDARRRSRLRAAGMEFLRSGEPRPAAGRVGVRFDIAAVIGSKVEVITAAF
ncbi:MAG: YraN family protein [Actinomycetia bacterium]|nr:YraN family protein [Actinomycetes bacterium]